MKALSIIIQKLWPMLTFCRHRYKQTDMAKAQSINAGGIKNKKKNESMANTVVTICVYVVTSCINNWQKNEIQDQAKLNKR